MQIGHQYKSICIIHTAFDRVVATVGCFVHLRVALIIGHDSPRHSLSAHNPPERECKISLYAWRHPAGSSEAEQLFRPLPCKCSAFDLSDRCLRLLGIGGDAVVYLQCPHIARKTIREPDDDFVSKYTQREIDVYTFLGPHPRIVEFYGHRQLEVLYLQPVPLGDLSNHFKRVNTGQIALPSLACRWQWLVDVAEGINFMHERGLMHQDVSVSNVLISENGQHAIICDLAGSFIPGHEVLNGYGTSGFTRFIQYNPPSFFQDRFALGCLAFYIIHGYLPYAEILHPDRCHYEGNSFAADKIVGRKYLREEYPELSTQLPSSVANHIMQCWQGAYQSTSTLLEDLTADAEVIKAATVDPYGGYELMTRATFLKMAAQTSLPKDLQM